MSKEILIISTFMNESLEYFTDSGRRATITNTIIRIKFQFLFYHTGPIKCVFIGILPELYTKIGSFQDQKCEGEGFREHTLVTAEQIQSVPLLTNQE